MKYVVQEDTRVATTEVAFNMKAGEPVELSERQAKAALQFGAIPVTGDVPKDDSPNEQEVEASVKEAIQTLLDEGTIELSMTGFPKMNQVKKLAPDATPEIRDRIWDEFFNKE